MKNKFCSSILFLSLILLLNNKCLALENKFKDSEVNEGKNIYITFDDGPSNNITDKILDILKEKDVKATFFLVGCKVEGNQDILKRIYNEGHGIGLHTYTHEYKKIYSSEEAFINEMKQTEEEIYKVIGIRSKIIRFPSGSKKYLTNSLFKKLQEEGYKIYDWNICVSDGLDYKTPSSKLYREATKENKFSRVILLMHCADVNKNTCEVLPKIIDYYKNMGYQFKVIDDKTPEYKFRIIE